MPKRKKKDDVSRRGFLKGAAAGAAVFVTHPVASAAPEPARPAAVLPTEAQLAAETGDLRAPGSTRLVENPASDFMVDVIKTLGFEYCPMNPGSSFEGLHESIINYGQNTMPELLTCCHEESAVAMAHGFAKIEGKPMIVLLHGNVGLQHASMAIYNAYADRVPVYLVVGNHLDAAHRRGGVPWYHSAQDMALMVRDFVKWDDEPASLAHFAESAVRAYRIAMTPPMAPVLIVLDSEMQERPAPAARVRIPKLTLPSPPAGDAGAVREAARLLVAAQSPLIVAQRAARTPQGIPLLVELAETLQAPVTGITVTGATVSERMNFPSRHPLCGSGLAGYQPDVTLGLEVQDMSAAALAAAARGGKTISISSEDLYLKSNNRDFQRMAEVDLAIAADAEATLPHLIEEVKRLITPDRRRGLDERGTRLADAHRQERARLRELAADGWDASPISVARMTAELWARIRTEDWSLVSWQGFVSRWPQRLWNFEKHHHYIGGQGAGGMGYGSGAAVGAALANRKHGRVSINIQGDGDLNYAPGVLWTAVHHRIPLLTLVHNNRGYHQEVMFVQQMASERNRGADRAHIGTTLSEPNINYAKMAESYGMYAEGPIEDPKELGPAIGRSLERVKRGEPALIDVVSQPR
jgi:thiamine pyrophosphate-dependent acetolactate synthase large subunit-like protein